MSLSPPIRRYQSVSPTAKQEELINAYEAEEERIINVLSRKLEQLREEKIELGNVLEAESESHVNRMSRELTALRLAQQQFQAQQSQAANSDNGMMSVSVSPDTRIGFRSFMSRGDPGEPNAETLLEAMRRENEQLRNRLVDTERDYIRILRLNEIYREELIEHRRRLGISVDNLIGLASSDPFSQPTHHRLSSSSSSTSSPSTSVYNVSSVAPRPTHGVPIPRPPSQIHRPMNLSSLGNTPLSHSPSSAESPFPFSPVTSTNPASFVSASTNITSPPSSLSLNDNSPVTFGTVTRGLSYPSVPPPSLSSSFGSPTVPYHMPTREHSLSPIEPLSRRNSNIARGNGERRQSVADNGNVRHYSQSGSPVSRRASIDRGARVAETGSLLTRNRAGSQTLSSTIIDASESDDSQGDVESTKTDGPKSESS